VAVTVQMIGTVAQVVLVVAHDSEVQSAQEPQVKEATEAQETTTLAETVVAVVAAHLLLVETVPVWRLVLVVLVVLLQ
jgi:hypothetical protein